MKCPAGYDCREEYFLDGEDKGMIFSMVIHTTYKAQAENKRIFSTLLQSALQVSCVLLEK